MEVKTGGSNLNLINRERFEASAVNNVISYDDTEILMETKLGLLDIKGEGMHITTLNLEQGKIVVDGYIHRIEYVEDKGAKMKNKGKNIISKLLR
ncbi:MAG: sporulation protein YabP [Clostridia bacterium]|nr:sporulation protein YabP [Clostridia bacterium]